MTKEQVSTYTMRISQANVSALAVIIYDMVLDYMDEGMEYYEKKDTVHFEGAMQKAQAALQELMAMSKVDSQVACDVMSLYLFIDKQLLMSIVKQEPVHLSECRGYLERLRASFIEISKTDTDAPLMEHTQQVYAGLTYGKGRLNESFDPIADRNRGFQA